MDKVAFIFPGQGAQFVGMGKDFYDNFEIAKDTYNLADELLCYKLTDICFNGPEEDLMLTENTQPAILATSVAILKVLQSAGLSCDYTAGLSLGEYSALINAGAMKFTETVKLVRNRGIYMQQVVQNGFGRMGAIVGLSDGHIKDIIKQSRDYGLIQIANYNTYEQIVLSGEKKAVNYAIKKAKESGARKALPLPVSAPFHCKLLEPAGLMLKRDLQNIDIKNTIMPFISNVSAGIVTEKDKIKQHLVRQVSNPVLWRQTIELLLNKDVNIFIEIGPGTTLSNFIKAIAEYNKINVISESIGDIEGLHKVLKYF